MELALLSRLKTSFTTNHKVTNMDMDRVISIKEDLATISDEDLVLFADFIYSDSLSTVKEYIEAVADVERESNCDF